MNLVYNVVFHPETEGGFTAIVPSLPGCVSYGATLEKAHLMIQDAILGYVQSLKKHHERVPSDESVYVASVHVRHAKKQRAVYA